MIKNYPILKKIAPLFFLFSALSHFKQSVIKVRLLSLLVFAVFSFKGNSQQCTFTGATVNSSSIVPCTELSGCSIVYIGDGVNPTTLTINNDLDLTCLGPIQLVVRNSATIFFQASNRLTLEEGSNLIIETGGDLAEGSPCSASQRIYIGSNLISSCNGNGGANFDFGDLVTNGGYSSINAIANPSSFCNTGSSVITATAIPSSNAIYRWYDMASGGSLLQNGGSTFNTGIITTTKTYYVEAYYSVGSYSTVRKAVTVTVNVLPTVPTVGAITHPTCSFTTGNVILSGLPSGNWTINPGAITGNTASTTISGLPAGTYNYTVTNAAGCTSTASANVVINAQPANNVWNGTVSTDWNTGGNWSCGGVPTISTNVLIPTTPTGGKYPILSTFIDPSYPEGYAKNIVFESGTTLIIENNALNVTGILTLNGKIDLNNEAQLVQDAGSTFDAASTGNIEIDQQGTSDNFRYNYWGSPVNTTGTSYTIAGVLRDGTIPAAINEFNFIDFGAPYAYADVAVTSPIRLSTYWMYKYANLGIGYSGWTSVGKDGNLNAGEGFTMKGSNTNLPEQNYTFVGKPNNGDINLTISANNDYLIGNPYPSAIDAQEFIKDNISGPSGRRTVDVIDGNLYFWDHFGGGSHLLKSYEGGYGIVNLTGETKAMATDALINNTGNTSTKIPPKFIPVAQGFFVTAVSGIVGTENIQFKNNQRLYKKENPLVSQFMKSAKFSESNKETEDEDAFPKIYLKYSSPKGFHRQILVGFIENTTDGVDVGYDAINNETFAEDMAWRADNINFIIQAVPTLNNERILPIEIKVAKTGIVKINIDKAENIPYGTEIFIKDSNTGEKHNISQKTFEINLGAGKYTDRFALTFKTQKLVAEDVNAEILIPAAAQPIIEGIHVYMNNAIGELQIKNNSNKEIVSVALINSLGQTVKTWNSNFNLRTISLPLSTATGIYFVQINTKTGNMVKKISVE